MRKLLKPRWFGLAALLGGLGLFVLLIRKTGFHLILTTVWHVGAWFLVLILFSGARHIVRTFAWHLSIEPGERRVKFLELLGFRVAGDAVTDLTFLGPVLGEAVKTVAVSRRMSAPHGASSVLIENLSYGLSVVFLIFSGLLIFFYEFAPSREIKVAGSVGCLILALPVFAVSFLIVKRVRLLGALLERLKKSNFNRDFLERVEMKVALFEDNVHGFYERHKALSGLILLLEIVAGLAGILETYFILALTTSHASFLAAFIAEAALRMVNTVFAFVPMRVGVEEGGAALALGAMGYTVGEGVSLGVIRKIRTLFWVSAGLLILARTSLEEAQKEEDPAAASAAQVLR